MAWGQTFAKTKIGLALGTLQELFNFPGTSSGRFLAAHDGLRSSSSLLWCGRCSIAVSTAHSTSYHRSDSVTLEETNCVECVVVSAWGYENIFRLNRTALTTADPIATPPAVAAICWNIDGCCGAAAIGDIAVGAGWETADGGGAAAAGGGDGRAAGAVDICLKRTNVKMILCATSIHYTVHGVCII